MGIAADLKHALRNLRLAPGFHCLLIGILALGIATSAAMFSLVDGVLLRPLPYRDPGRLVTLTSFAADPKFDSNGSLPYYDFEQIKARARSFKDVAVTYRTGWSAVTLTGGPEPQPAQGAFVSPDFFAVFDVAPLLGRTFTAGEDRRGLSVVVLSEGLAISRYGSAANSIGRDLEIGGAPWRVIGVMPSSFRVPFLDTRLWMPVHSHPEWNDKAEANPRLRQRWDVLARLRRGVRISAAQAEVDTLEARFRAALPEYHRDNVRVIPLREYFTGGVRKQLWILFAAVAFLLLIAWVNAGSLLLSRAASRQREFAVRSALGGARARLFRQLFIESTTLSVIAGLVGAVAAAALVPVLKAFAPAGIPRIESVSLDARVLGFALVLSTVTGILLGLAPAFNLVRGGASGFIATSARATRASSRSRRTRNVLVAAEFAVAMVLLTGAALLIRSFIAVQNVNPGFQPQNVLTIRVALPNATPSAAATQFYAQAMDRIAALPGVQAIGGVSNLFFLDEKRTHALRLVEGRPTEPRSAWKPLVWTQISGAYFQAMGIRLLRGRYFDPADRAGAPLVAIVNETLAQRYWPAEDAIGKRLKGFDPRGRNDEWLSVVGIVQDTHSAGLERAPMAQIYEPQSQSGEQIGSFVIRTAGDPAAVAASVHSMLRAANPQVIVPSISTLEHLLQQQETSRRFQTWLVAVFSALALGLAAVGIFAVMHYSVSARTHELGIRMAVGARAADILFLVVRDGARIAAIGIAAGALAGVWAAGAISSMLYAVAPADPASFAAAAVLLAVVGVAASCFPARRASHVDPMTALRQY